MVEMMKVGPRVRSVIQADHEADGRGDQPAERAAMKGETP